MADPRDESALESWPAFFWKVPIYFASLILPGIALLFLGQMGILPGFERVPYGIVGGMIIFGTVQWALRKPWAKLYYASIFSALLAVILYPAVIPKRDWSAAWYLTTIAAALVACFAVMRRRGPQRELATTSP